jgi:hypothetical protein
MLRGKGCPKVDLTLAGASAHGLFYIVAVDPCQMPDRSVGRTPVVGVAFIAGFGEMIVNMWSRPSRAGYRGAAVAAVLCHLVPAAPRKLGRSFLRIGWRGDDEQGGAEAQRGATRTHRRGFGHRVVVLSPAGDAPRSQAISNEMPGPLTDTLPRGHASTRMLCTCRAGCPVRK